LPLIFLPRIVKDRRVRPLLIIGGVFIVGLCLNVWFYAHYAAPALGLIYVLVLQGMRHLRVWKWRGHPAGVLMARSVPLVCLLMAVVRLGAQPLGKTFMPPDWPMTWFYARPGNTDRAAIVKRLESEPGRQLAIVRYRHDHSPFEEWVYNDANIDASKIVWAREMDAARNRELINYFHDRRVWLVEPDEKPPALAPYQSP
jgi:hypothetical protein